MGTIFIGYSCSYKETLTILYMDIFVYAFIMTLRNIVPEGLVLVGIRAWQIMLKTIELCNALMHIIALIMLPKMVYYAALHPLQ